jgi:hypothetical protein
LTSTCHQQFINQNDYHEKGSKNYSYNDCCISSSIFYRRIIIPKTYHVERSITINAPREEVWSNVNSLHGLHSWSPWIEADPNVKITYEGQDGTVGAAYHWVGNSDVGEGHTNHFKD